MEQLHKRFTAEQVKVLLRGYCQGMLERTAIEEILGINKTRFFTLLMEYCHDQDGFSRLKQMVKLKDLTVGYKTGLSELALLRN